MQERKVSAGSEPYDANDEEKQISEKKVDFLYVYSLYFESEGRKTCWPYTDTYSGTAQNNEKFVVSSEFRARIVRHENISCT